MKDGIWLPDCFQNCFLPPLIMGPIYNERKWNGLDKEYLKFNWETVEVAKEEFENNKYAREDSLGPKSFMNPLELS